MFLSQVYRLHSFNMDHHKFATTKEKDESSHQILLGLSKVSDRDTCQNYKQLSALSSTKPRNKL